MKFTIELTPEQLVALSAICTSIIVDNYDKLPLLKEEAMQISKSSMVATKSLKPTMVKCTQEEPKEIVGNTLSTEFFDTFNFYVEDDGDSSLIDDDENLRLIYGKQGQIGIEYWEHYNEGDKADDVMFIKNADAKELKSELGKILSALSTARSVISMRQVIANKYQFNINTDSRYCKKTNFALCKKNDNETINSVIFSNKKQLEIFYKFLEYHLD